MQLTFPPRISGTIPAAATMLAMLAMFGGCSGQLARPFAAKVQPAADVEASTVTLTCEKSDQVAALLAPLIATAVDFGINAISAALKAEQAHRNAVWAATGVAEACSSDWSGTAKLQIRRAVIDREGKPISGGSPGFDLTGVVTMTQLVVAAGDKASEKPGAAPAAAKATPMLQIGFAPTSFDYGRTAARRHGSGRKHVVVLLGFTPDAILKTAAGAKGDEVIPGVLRLDLGTLRDGFNYTADMLPGARAIGTIGVPAGGKVNVTAIVVESEDEDLVLKALTDAFDSNKGDLAKALKSAIGGN